MSLNAVVPPLLAIHGIQDEYGLTRHSELIGQLTAGPARMEILADTYRVPQGVRPGDILNLVVGFIAAAR